MLTLDQKSEIRRHLRYPAISRGHLPYPFGQTELFHYEQSESFLEQRLDLLVPLDEAKLSGEILGVIAFVGPQPTAGATFSITITSTDLVSPVTVGPIAFVTGDTLTSMASKLSQAVVMNATLATAQISAGGPYGPGLAGQDIPLPQVVFKAPKAFTFAITVMTGIGIVIQQQGVHVEPHFDGIGNSCIPPTNPPTPSTVYGYLPILAALETLILNSSARAQIVKAADYVRGDELGERKKLYDMWCVKLATFLGVSMGTPSSGYSNSFSL